MLYLFILEGFKGKRKTKGRKWGQKERKNNSKLLINSTDTIKIHLCPLSQNNRTAKLFSDHSVWAASIAEFWSVAGVQF